MIDLIKKIFGIGGSLVIVALRIALVLSAITGVFTGDWTLLFVVGGTIVFALLVLRGMGNQIAAMAACLPFSRELFGIDEEILKKGEKVIESGWDIFKRH